MKRVIINNFRCMLGQKKQGVQYGGDMIIDNLKPRLTRKHGDNDINNISINKYSDYHIGYKVVKNNMNKGYFNLNLGGDHSISAATIQPLVEKYKDDLLVIWIDAHADLNTYDASNTKNLHGMPLAALTGLMDHWYNVSNKQIHLQPENLLYIGIRDLDSFESNTIAERGIANFPTYTSEIRTIIERHPAKHIHISCDIDSMDPILMPSTGTAVPNGLSVKNVLNIIGIASPRLVSFDLVEFNPLIGNIRKVKTTLGNINRILTKVL
jgi:arginase